MKKRYLITGISILSILLVVVLSLEFKSSPTVSAEEIITPRSSIAQYNRLGQEKSPYLLQHKDNPVNWFPWGKEAFQAAKGENKLIFLSIGYSTCYWCHVMENDSFERKDVADDFIRKNLHHEGKLLRRYRDGESALTGTVNDYAFLIHGLLTLYESDFDSKWVRWAQTLQAKQDDSFWDEKNGGYYLTEVSEEALLIRKKEFDDGVTPSGNSLAALNLARLHDLTFDEKYAERLNRLLGVMTAVAKRYPASYAQAMMAMDYKLDRSKEVAYMIYSIICNIICN